MTTNSVTNGVTDPAYQQAPLMQNKNLGQADFLRLMVAQVQNQDPLEPQQNGEFIAQLAQFSANDGITNMQKSLEQLANTMQSSQALQASSLVGHKVLVDSSTIALEKTGESKVQVEVPEGVNTLKAYIYSKSGELVKTIPLNDAKSGVHVFSWDGTNDGGQRLEEGEYKVKVNAMQAGQEVALNTMTTANVNSVSFGLYGAGMTLNVSGIGPITLDRIRQIDL